MTEQWSSAARCGWMCCAVLHRPAPCFHKAVVCCFPFHRFSEAVFTCKSLRVDLYLHLYPRNSETVFQYSKVFPLITRTAAWSFFKALVFKTTWFSAALVSRSPLIPRPCRQPTACANHSGHVDRSGRGTLQQVDSIFHLVPEGSPISSCSFPGASPIKTIPSRLFPFDILYRGRTNSSPLLYLLYT